MAPGGDGAAVWMRRRPWEGASLLLPLIPPDATTVNLTQFRVPLMEETITERRGCGE